MHERNRQLVFVAYCLIALLEHLKCVHYLVLAAFLKLRRPTTGVHDTKCNACMITLLQEIHLITNVNCYPSAIGLGSTVGFETQKHEPAKKSCDDKGSRRRFPFHWPMHIESNEGLLAQFCYILKGRH
jgi:hypothetical protein